MSINCEQLDNLYQQVGPQLLAYFQRRHPDAHAAEDLLHETFAAVLRSPERLKHAVSPRAYLFGVARNLSFEAYRNRPPFEELPAELPAGEPTESDPRLPWMRRAIARLNPTWREVLELRLQQELSYEEIAAVLEVPIGTVRSRLHYAVKDLQKTMKLAQQTVYEK